MNRVFGVYRSVTPRTVEIRARPNHKVSPTLRAFFCVEKKDDEGVADAILHEFVCATQPYS